MHAFSADALLQCKALSRPAWAPDGAAAAYCVTAPNAQTDGYDTDLWLWEAAGETHKALTGHGKVTSFVWLDDGTLLYGRGACAEEAAEQGPGTRFYTLARDGAEQLLFSVELDAQIEGVLANGLYVLGADFDPARRRALAELAGAARTAALRRWKEEDARAATAGELPVWKDGEGLAAGKRRGVFLYDAAAAELRQLSGDDLRVEAIRLDKIGGRILCAAAAAEPVEALLPGIYMYDAAGGQTCLLPQNRWRVDDLDFAEGNILFAGSTLESHGIDQRPDLVLLHPGTGRTKTLWAGLPPVGSLVNSDCRHGGGRVFCAYKSDVYLIGSVEEQAHLLRWNAAQGLQTLWAADGCADSFDVCGAGIVCVALQGMTPQELYLLPANAQAAPGGTRPPKDAAPETARRLSAHNEAFLRRWPPLLPEPLRTQSRDGVDIHGFVLPAAGAKGSTAAWPAVLCIHGGPYTSYGRVYHHEMQLLAHRGYFVLYCNPRGSAGRPDGFGDIRGDFGGRDAEDILAFCDAALAAWPAIDPARLCVAGGSYGGFMTNWLICRSARFAAAISQRGISNFLSFAGTSDIGPDFVRLYGLGSVEETPEKLWGFSPLKHVKGCTTPTLFVHADEDRRCPPEQALQMYAALVRKGVPARLTLFHGEGHELSRSGKPKSRIARLEEMVAWLDQWCRPGK